jgi:hypothetical protein
MPIDVKEGLILQREKVPQLVRSGAIGGEPTKWEEELGPILKTAIGEPFLLYLYPAGDPPEGGWSADDLKKARSTASVRAASINNRYWNHVPDEHVQAVVRLREDGRFGVWATHHGEMTAEIRSRIARRRRARPRKTGETETAEPESEEVFESPEQPTTAAQRAKAAAAAKRQS